MSFEHRLKPSVGSVPDTPVDCAFACSLNLASQEQGSAVKHDCSQQLDPIVLFHTSYIDALQTDYNIEYPFQGLALMMYIWSRANSWEQAQQKGLQTSATRFTSFPSKIEISQLVSNSPVDGQCSRSFVVEPFQAVVSNNTA